MLAFTAYLIILIAQPHGGPPLKRIEPYPSLEACQRAILDGTARVPAYAVRRCVEELDVPKKYEPSLRNQDPTPIIR